ncbi:acyltransferase family protein [Paraburkholderia bryophila]|uniref:Peptidoglycan/LPS O-acetylase OafA/YrhL n=1 Tax=Paraburkholderia bryophila TaxID=420952 RepID=A0A7Y9W8X1_9BURK|nr:acyltransferase [Paraburkholderia bryophila]NYH16359.1 peptidoglycan/LPS O-acetylase OafA/YrhL [Paraburkholderia bryophila]
MNEAGQRNRRIDLIRGVSILLVLFHHFNIAYHLNDTTLAGTFGWNVVRAVARNGNYGVTMFFVISGFLITSNAGRRWAGLGSVDTRAFYARRVARIMPCLLLLLAIVNVAALAGLAMFQNHAPAGPSVSFWIVNLASLTFWMNVLIGAHGWVNYPLGVLWSLSVEEVFYLAFPLLCIVLRRESRLLAFWLVIAAIGPLYRFTHQSDEGGFLYAYFACFDGIAIGCCAAVLAKRFVLRGRWAVVLQGVVVAGMTYLYLYRPIGETNVLGVTAMALGTAVLLLAAYDRNDAPREKSAWYTPMAGIAWFGRRSYELYLFHLIVLGAIRTVRPPRVVMGDEKLLLLALFFVLSAILSAGVARFYSEPLNRKLRNWLNAV